MNNIELINKQNREINIKVRSERTNAVDMLASLYLSPNNFTNITSLSSIVSLRQISNYEHNNDDNDNDDNDDIDNYNDEYHYVIRNN